MLSVCTISVCIPLAVCCSLLSRSNYPSSGLSFIHQIIYSVLLLFQLYECMARGSDSSLYGCNEKRYLAAGSLLEKG